MALTLANTTDCLLDNDESGSVRCPDGELGYAFVAVVIGVPCSYRTCNALLPP